MQAHEEAARATGYLERLQEDVRADIRSLRFSRDPALMRRFPSASGEHRPTSYAEARGTAPEIGATRADANRILERMRTRPNFEGYVRDSMYWAQLSALLFDGVIQSAEELDATIAREIEALRR